MRPNEVVESLNAYFRIMVDIIMGKSGIVDKYMGDAIMAFYGAPVMTGDEARQALESAFEMMASLKEFNVWQVKRGRPEFRRASASTMAWSPWATSAPNGRWTIRSSATWST